MTTYERLRKDALAAKEKVRQHQEELRVAQARVAGTQAWEQIKKDCNIGDWVEENRDAIISAYVRGDSKYTVEYKSDFKCFELDKRYGKYSLQQDIFASYKSTLHKEIINGLFKVYDDVGILWNKVDIHWYGAGKGYPVVTKWWQNLLDVVTGVSERYTYVEWSNISISIIFS